MNRNLPIALAWLILVCGSLMADDIPFRLHVVDSQSEHHSAAAFDVNLDGKTDIVTGGWWYEAPDWKKVKVREVEQIRGRFDDYSCLPFDVNADGFTDFISANYRSESIYWVENPGPQAAMAGSEWKHHLVEKPGAMETGRLFDVDGDGRLDLIPNGIKFASWWDIQPGSAPQWNRYPLPDELAGHGIGTGDINGDGRLDLVGRFGWAEAPEDQRSGRWVFHADFQIERDASIPMLVSDVDSDGDADIVWGRGHKVGLHWLEQHHDSDGTRRWIRHAIDTSWSQPHSLLFADISGDGQPDVIAGKRHLGHDGKDPGEYDPLVCYWYEFFPASRTWKRHAISIDGVAGFGLDPKAIDLDGDSDLDLLSCDRNGLIWLENQRIERLEKDSPSPVAPTPSISSNTASLETAKYDSHQDVMVYRNVRDELKPVTTPQEMGIRRRHILAAISEAMGPLPATDLRVPLDVAVESEESSELYIRKRISFTPEPGDRVPAWLLIPKNIATPAAAMLCLHQTTDIGKGEPAGLGGRPNLHYAHELANRGFVCIVPDYPSFGDYPYDFQTTGKHFASGSMKAIWNNIRAIDVLETLPEVDSDRIGCIGHSLGGHNTLFTAAFDVRIRAAVTSCGFTAFHHYYNGNLVGWTSDRYMPRIRDEYSNDPNKVPFDFYEVLAAIAPRAVFINAPVSDDNFDVTGVRKVVDSVRDVYDLYGATKNFGDIGNRLISRYPECSHDFPSEIREEAYAWLSEQLK